MLIRTLLFLALPAMLIPPGICLCHIGEAADESPMSSHDEPAPLDDDDHDDNCPCHGQGQAVLVKRSTDGPVSTSLPTISAWVSGTDVVPAAVILREHFPLVPESTPLYLSLLTLRI